MKVTLEAEAAFLGHKAKPPFPTLLMKYVVINVAFPNSVIF